jgi:hypothetical protein
MTIGYERENFSHVRFSEFRIRMPAALVVGVQYVLGMSAIGRAVNVLKIFKAIVCWIAVLVIYLKVAWPNKCLHDEAVDQAAFVHTVDL